MLADTTPMSWWLYFADEARARAAERELERDDFLTLVEHRPDVPHRAEKWVLRAARPVPGGGFFAERARLRDVAGRHGGVYEGFDSGWLWGEAGLEQMGVFLREVGL